MIHTVFSCVAPIHVNVTHVCICDRRNTNQALLIVQNLHLSILLEAHTKYFRFHSEAQRLQDMAPAPSVANFFQWKVAKASLKDH